MKWSWWSFDTSAPVSSAVERDAIGDPQMLPLSVKFNGTLRQQGNTRSMIFPVDALIAFLSGIFTLEAGDLIYTGTPEGVGPVVPGDTLEAELGQFAYLRVSVAQG